MVKSVSVIDSCPALSTARTSALWGPFDIWRVTLVLMPTVWNAPPSMLSSYRAMPDAASDPVHVIVTVGFVRRPLGRAGPRSGFVRSTPIALDFIVSMYPALSRDW